MKKIVLILLVVFMTEVSQAQSFGIKGGINFSSLTGNDAGGFKGLTSFHLGILKEFIISKKVSFQPELLYSTQGVQIKGMDDDYKLNYFTLPLMVKFYVNNSFSLHAGPQLAVLAGETRHVVPFEGKTFDYGIAGGVEYLLTDWLFVQGRYSIGLTKMSDDADLKNSVVQLSIGFFL